MDGGLLKKKRNDNSSQCWRLAAFGCPTKKELAKTSLSLEIQEGYGQTWYLPLLCSLVFSRTVFSVQRIFNIASFYYHAQNFKSFVKSHYITNKTLHHYLAIETEPKEVQKNNHSELAVSMLVKNDTKQTLTNRMVSILKSMKKVFLENALSIRSGVLKLPLSKEKPGSRNTIFRNIFSFLSWKQRTGPCLLALSHRAKEIVWLTE